MQAGNVLLEVKGLKVHFPIEKGFFWKRKAGWVRAVDGVSFSIDRGETLGLVGESGCGKSTTAMAVARLCAATAGEILFQGRDLRLLSKDELQKARMDMQIVFQDPYSSLNPRMKAGDIIAEPMRIYARQKLLAMSPEEIGRRVGELMDRVGLARDFMNRYPHEFSGGQRQRIGVARALALKPKLILADEPVSALDVSIQSQILNLLKDLQEELDLTYLFIAHDLAVIEHISSRVAVMYLGRIMEATSSSILHRNPLHPYTGALLSAVPLPDPAIEKKRKRIILKGDVPSPDKERIGCYFFDRCPQAFDRCRAEIPSLRAVEENHQVACFLYGG